MKNHSLEKELERNNVKLVQQMIMNVLDRIRIKDSWYKRRPSERMIKKKEASIDELGPWLETDSAKFWFRMYGNCTGKNGDRMLDNFKEIALSTIKFLEDIKS